MRKVLKIIVTAISLLIIIVVVDKCSFYIAGLIYPIIANIDVDNVYMVLVLHHIIQIAIVYPIISLVIKYDNSTLSDRGLNFSNFSYSLKAIIIFSTIWLLIQFTAGYYMINYTSYVHSLFYPLTIKNAVAMFSFQLFLTGTSEELLFRFLPLSVLLFVTKASTESNKFKLLFIIISTIIFMLGHIGFSTTTLKIVHFSILQQLTTLVFGVFYGWLFIKTNSIIGSMIAHGVLNTIIISSELIFHVVY